MHLTAPLFILGAGFATLVSCANENKTNESSSPASDTTNLGDPGFPSLEKFSPEEKIVPGITWQPCYPSKPTRHECGRIEVPFDYKDVGFGKMSLPVARLNATKTPKLGTILLNPGGPGANGTDSVLFDGNIIMELTGGQYDLVAWNPRGLFFTAPDAVCFKSFEEEENFWNGTIPYEGIEAKGNFTNPADLKAFYAQVPQVDKKLKAIGVQCNKTSPDMYPYIGSTSAVRDMLSIHDTLEGPKKPVNFMGQSYGTIIGVYFVNMFPDRVGRVVLDAVVDPEIWANRPAHELWNRTIDSADAALDGFAKECASAGPKRCALASQNSTAGSVKQEILQLMDRAYEHKKSLGPKTSVSSSRVRNELYNALYAPTRWQKFAQTLKNVSNFLDKPDDRDPFPPPKNPDLLNDYNFQAIACADAAPAGNITTQAVFESLENSARTASPVFGQLWSEAGLYCHNWPFRAVERFTGPFNKKLSNKIIVVGNTADPSTPFKSAKAVANALGDSAFLLEQEGFGHTVLAMRSNCTFRIMQNYFSKGTPPSENFCKTDQVLFPASPDAPPASVPSKNPPPANSPPNNPPPKNPPPANSSSANPPTANPPTANPSTANPPTANPPTANPSTANPPTANPPTTNPSSANPSSANPSTANPSSANPGSANPPPKQQNKPRAILVARDDDDDDKKKAGQNNQANPNNGATDKGTNGNFNNVNTTSDNHSKSNAVVIVLACVVAILGLVLLLMCLHKRKAKVQVKVKHVNSSALEAGEKKH